MKNDLEKTAQQRVTHANNIIPFIKKDGSTPKQVDQAAMTDGDTDQLERLQGLIDDIQTKSLKLKLIQLKLMQLELERKIAE